MDPKLFIIAERCGRLANRIVLFANFIALAEEQRHRLINFTFHSYARMFEQTRHDIYCQYPATTRVSRWDAIPAVGDAIRKTRIFYHLTRATSRLSETFPVAGKSVMMLRENPGGEVTLLDGPEVQGRICHARTIFVNGWTFRTPSLVQRHAGKIRAYFQPIAEYADASRAAVEHLRREADVVVGVHIRRGDYETWCNGRCFFPVAHYATWMRELAEQFPARKVAFFVCSNEPMTPRDFAGLPVGLGAGSAVGDLYALAQCDYVLGPMSTFSQWAAFYGNKPLLQLYNQTDRVELARFRPPDFKEIPGLFPNPGNT